MNRTKKLIWILAILLVLAIGYIAVDKYTDYREQQKLSIFQQGAQAGYEQAIRQLMQQAQTCQPIPVYVENNTVNLISIECLETK